MCLRGGQPSHAISFLIDSIVGVHGSCADFVIPIIYSVAIVTVVIVVTANVSIVVIEVGIAAINSIVGDRGDWFFALETAPVKAAFLVLGTVTIQGAEHVKGPGQ